MLKLALNSPMGAPGFIEHFEQFGTHGYAITVLEDHVTYLRDVNSDLRAVSEAFDPELVRRWFAVNELLVHAHRPPAPIPRRLRLEFPGLAALVAFPLLEEISRRVSKARDEDGLLNRDIPKEFGLWRINSKGVRESKEFKAGQRIVDLSHKLFVMKAALSPEFQASIESLDRRLSISRFEGVEMPHVTLFERIEYLRNMWLHGRRFDGVEAWLVTFFLGMLFYRLPQSDIDRGIEAADKRFRELVNQQEEKDANVTSRGDR